jgi:protein NUD1
MNPCTLGWYLPLLVKDVPGALQPSEGNGDRDEDHEPRGRKKTDFAWKELDSKFRRDLPDEVYVGRLAYRGLVMRACPRVHMLDGVDVSEKERVKALRLLQGISGKRKGTHEAVCRRGG